jgi:hypothetical protein
MSSPIRHTGKANSDTTHGQCSISKPGNMKHMLSTGSNTSEASTSTQGWPTLDHTFIGDHVQRSFNSARSSLDDTPHNLNVNLRVATAMSQFYSLLRRFKPARGFDLNTCVPHEDTSLQSPTLILHSASGVLPNPWHLGYAWSNDGVKTTRVYDKLNSIEDDDRYVYVMYFAVPSTRYFVAIKFYLSRFPFIQKTIALNFLFLVDSDWPSSTGIPNIFKYPHWHFETSSLASVSSNLIYLTP